MPMPNPNLAITKIFHTISAEVGNIGDSVLKIKGIFMLSSSISLGSGSLKKEGTPVVGVLRQQKLIKVVVMNV